MCGGVGLSVQVRVEMACAPPSIRVVVHPLPALHICRCVTMCTSRPFPLAADLPPEALGSLTYLADCRGQGPSLHVSNPVHIRESLHRGKGCCVRKVAKVFPWDAQGRNNVLETLYIN